ncbi:lysophospholipase [Stieleria sp. TO1_6]|uniref:alpha/beta fold hydrolase n=1 Tax=Stieleria tagensis TaxID=2956795 RepID=UPI00209B8CBD|nr:alpha/beta fold hydrolase [Stieleria tagensis]MCO8123598.1 lysophospholipase [Stieleria tagensis]
MNSVSETVIVIHGYACSSVFTQPLRYRLSKRGFKAVCWSYHSLWGTVEGHAQRLRAYLDKLDEADERFHIVAHSMGSAITRAALCDSQPDGLRRIVFLAPPISGLPLARLSSGITKWISRPFSELSDAPDSYVNSLPSPDQLEIGVIAAKYDCLVPLKNTTMPGLRDRITLGATHNSLLFDRQVVDLAAGFLRAGRFQIICR